MAGGVAELIRSIPSEHTHGRWPWLAAAVSPAATVLAYRRRERLADDGSWVAWLPLGALLWHQTEEWVWPGGFLPWFNREVAGCDEDEYPITRPLGLAINTGLGWGVGIAAGASRSPALAAFQLALLAGNVGLHIAEAGRTRRRNPGLITAVALFAPLAAAGSAKLWRRPRDRRPVAAGAAAGVGASAALMVAMRRRARRVPDSGDRARPLRGRAVEVQVEAGR